MGAFRIYVPKKAVSVDFKKLSKDQQKNLANNRQFNAAEHQIWQITISVDPNTPTRKMNKRDRKKNDFQKANLCMVYLRPSKYPIQIIGISPKKKEIGNPPSSEVGSLELEALSTKVKVSGSLTGLLKYIQKKEKIMCLGIHQKFAKWFFFKKFIQENYSFELFIMTEKFGFEDDHPYLLCDVEFKHGGRLVNQALKKRVTLSAI